MFRKLDNYLSIWLHAYGTLLGRCLPLWRSRIAEDRGNYFR